MSGQLLSLDSYSVAELSGLLFVLDPVGFGGVRLYGMPGRVREAWVSNVKRLLEPEQCWRRIPASVDIERLLGGLDFAATLNAGRPVFESGILALADQGVVQLAMAERLERTAVAIICRALDTGSVSSGRGAAVGVRDARFGVVANDESMGDDETLDPALADRLGLVVVLANHSAQEVAFNGVTRSLLAVARRRQADVSVSAQAYEHLAAVASALGVGSCRGELYALRALRAIAALRGEVTVSDDDMALAVRLTLSQRATRMPVSEDEQPPESAPEPRPADAEAEAERNESKLPNEASDIVLDAARAAVPDGLLAAAGDATRARRLAAGRGRAGALRRRRASGKPVGTLPADRVHGGRINLLASLKAALPWQRVRPAQSGGGPALQIRKSDLQVTRYKDRDETTTIFVVDASGSQAAQRLSEVKGAIELLLADCYVSRDEVALIVFRGSEADLLLPPTRALARAKRTLAAMPAGGGTPLTSGINRARELVESTRREGRTPRVVFLTDGRANVASDGTKGRDAARKEALLAARLFRMTGLRPVVVDTSRRPAASAAEFADELGAHYVALPYANAATINSSIQQAAGV